MGQSIVLRWENHFLPCTLAMCTYLQEVADEVDGLAGDLLPRMGRVHEGRVLDLLVDVLILVEGERARETHVDDHARRPHIQAPVVPLVAEHLGRQVGRRAHHGLSKAFLTNDARETKVTELHLKIGRGERLQLFAESDRFQVWKD